MSTKVLVIGLDGATFDVIDPLLEAERLPHLARLRSEGVAVSLQSTFPAHSAPAWTSCRTGVNPGKHGIFNFWKRQAYEWSLTTSADLQVPSVERILSRQGRRTCTINIPLTYPPEPVNGIVISGLPAPGTDSIFTFPSSLCDELLACVGGYSVDSFAHFDIANVANLPRYLHQLYERHYHRRDVACHLLAREKWDYFMCVFTLPDRVQHRFWRFRESWQQDDNDLTRRFGLVIDQCYELLDETVGILLTEAGDDTTVLVISDHGFGPCYYDVYPNVWLREHGDLHLKLAHKVWARQIHWKRKQGQSMSRPHLTFGPPRRRIDWRRTRVFGGLGVKSPSLWLNLKGRDPQGVVIPGQEAERLLQTLTDDLLALTGYDNQPIFEHIYRPEQLYHGPYMAMAGDLLLAARNSYRIQGQFISRTVLRSSEQSGSVNGNHRTRGILFARGARVNTHSPPESPHIVDIAPTILQLLDEPLPSYMDGRPLFS